MVSGRNVEHQSKVGEYDRKTQRSQKDKDSNEICTILPENFNCGRAHIEKMLGLRSWDHDVLLRSLDVPPAAGT